MVEREGREPCRSFRALWREENEVEAEAVANRRGRIGKIEAEAEAALRHGK